jgi:outer membrane protein OmpA-like peptidoglycan-associated protein
MFDYAQRPVRLKETDLAPVSSYGFLRLDASLALWDRLLISVGFPFAVLIDGDDPSTAIADASFTALEAPKAGDLRTGLRVRIWGEDGGPFQLGAGGYFFVPTGDQAHYAGDGKVRGTPQISIGGRIGSELGFIYDASAGVALRSGGTSSAVTYGAGAGVLLADDLLQIGLEGYGASFTGNELDLSATRISTGQVLTAEAGTSVELLFGAKVRLLDGLTLGVGAGPGLGTAVGTPLFRAVGMVAWAPIPGPPAEEGPEEVGDKDDDGIKDDIDACPDVAGEPNADPSKDGCPPDDRDKDGVLDVEDACPNTPGLRNADVTKNGCPKDSDDDGVHDGIDRCPQVFGELSEDPKKNGCPADRDDDGIADRQDACPADAGKAHEDPKRNGCPEDPDGDGITWSDDACPTIAGVENDDPQRNGCPPYGGGAPGAPPLEEAGYHVLFKVAKSSLDDVTTVLKDSLADDINKKLAEDGVDHIEVQGHTDDSGLDEINSEVGLKRAEAIRTWLIQHGVPGDKLVAKGYSWTRPVADNRIRQGRQKNRRVQFVVIRK